MSNKNILSEEEIAKRMEQIVINTQGRKMKIKSWISSKKLEIEFLEDHAIRTGISYRDFLNGTVVHPEDQLAKSKDGRIGLVRKSKEGMNAEVIAYNTSMDFIIKFENGETRHMSSWTTFEQGNFSYIYTSGYKLSESEINDRKKLIIKNKQGYEMKLKEYISSTQVIVEFEDNNTKNTTYRNFVNGAVTHPIYKTMKKETLEKYKTHGIKDVLDYRGKQDIDVILDNDIIVYNTNHNKCISGKVNKDWTERNVSPEELAKRLNTIIKKGKGKNHQHEAHILNYHSYDNIDIEFEDGEKVYGITWNQFIKKNFIYPDDAHIKNVGLQKTYKSYQTAAKSRNLAFELSKEDVGKLIHEPCYLCGRKDVYPMVISGKEFYKNGIDRIDSSKGYTKDNVKPCCFDCNVAKLDNSLSDFCNWVKMVYKNISDERFEKELLINV